VNDFDAVVAAVGLDRDVGDAIGRAQWRLAVRGRRIRESSFGCGAEAGSSVSVGAAGSLDTIIDSLEVGSLEQPEVRKKAFPGSPSG
jgi:hypothetical protein